MSRTIYVLAIAAIILTGLCAGSLRAEETAAARLSSAERELEQLKDRFEREMDELRKSCSAQRIVVTDLKLIDCPDAGRPQQQTCSCDDGYVLVAVTYLDNDPRGGGDADKIVGLRCAKVRLEAP